MPANDQSEELVIRSEEDAWEALKRALGNDKFPEDLHVRFDGWPSLVLDVKGRDWHSTVPTRVMPPLIEVQNNINRAYAQVQYNEASTRRLRNEERDELELVVKVDKGSSLLTSELWTQLTKVAEAAVGRMSGNEIVICVAIVALSTTATVMLKAWLKQRQQTLKMQSQVQLSHQETERLRIVAAATQPRPQLATIRDDAQAASNQLLKATRPGDVMEIHGVSLPAEEAHALVQPERERAKEVELSGRFAILGNRTDKGAGFRITVKRVADGLTFAADVLPPLPVDQQDVIQNAEWSKQLIDLVVNADKLRDTVTRATVMSAKAVDGGKHARVTPIKPRR